jgi:hypothetical protein
MSRTLILGCFLAIGSTVWADQTPVSVPAMKPFGSLRAAESGNPYRTLFATQPATNSTPKETNRTVRCGMTIIEADPMFDSKMVRDLPKEGTKYTIRAVPPPVCGAPR